MTERKGELKTFGAKCKTFAKAASEARQKQAQAQQPVEELPLDKRVDNMAENLSNALNQHANALNALALWVETNDKKVQKAGGLMQWAIKETQKRERLAQRKADYAASKSTD